MLDLKGINKNIRLIQDAGIKLDARIHETGVSILNHAADHGDWTPIQRLYDALPKSARRGAFVKWVKDFSPLNFDDKTQKWAKSGKNTSRVYDVDGANKNPFWDYTKEIVGTLDVDKLLVLPVMVSQAIARLEKAEENGQEIKGNVTDFMTRADNLRALVA